MTPKLFYIVALAPLFAIAQNEKQSKWKSPAKNDLVFKISIPEGNHLYLNMGDHYGNAFGFLGLSIGCEYYLSDKCNLNGINYYPSFIVFDGKRASTRYGHLLFLELIFRIRTKK